LWGEKEGGGDRGIKEVRWEMGWEGGM